MELRTWVVAMALVTLPVHGAVASSSDLAFEWLSSTERLQAQRTDPAKDVHFTSFVETVDTTGGVVALFHPELSSRDGTISMRPRMMTFHVISSGLLRGIAPRDKVHVTVRRIRGAIMVINIRKIR